MGEKNRAKEYYVKNRDIKGWVKWSKILDYFKSSQKYPSRFYKNKISYYFVKI